MYEILRIKVFTYTAKVATCKRFGCFWKLLFLWKGSIYKLLWPNLIAYFIMYSTLSICYRFLLSDENKVTFERLSLHCQKYGDLIPVSFVLGFYVTIVVSRWWDQYTSMPWPDAFAIYVSSFINGMDEQSRLMRRTLVRYFNLTLVMAFTMISTAAKKRFPTLDHLQEAGFLMANEKKIIERMEARTKHPKYWLPLAWATALINEARRDDLIKDDFGLKTLIDEVIKFRSGCGTLLNFDWISIPLVYTQVVTLAVYTYFLATLMGNQYLDPTKGYPNHTIDLVVPIFTLLQFFFYMGWLLVAETLVNPFGEDDDDFEVNWLIDRNLQISYLIVDEVHENHPDIMKDPYWEEVVPEELPYTEAAKPTHTEPFMGSTRYVDVPMDQRNFVMMSLFAESEEMSIKTVIDRGDRKETAPVEILSPAKGDYNVATTSEVQKGSQSSDGNSVLRLLKANIYGSTGSVKSTGSVAGEILRTKRKKHSVISTTSRPFSLESESNRKDSADYLEDIFRMSDFSLRGSSCKVIGERKEGDKQDVSGAHSEHPNSINSARFGSIGSFHDGSNRNLGNIDIGRMTSWIDNTNSPFSTSFEKLGASFGGRSYSMRGQGEFYIADLDASSAETQRELSSSGVIRTPAVGTPSPDPMPSLDLQAGPSASLLAETFEAVRSVTSDNIPDVGVKIGAPAKGDGSEIVPLDEQILLYSSPSTCEVEEDDKKADGDLADTPGTAADDEESTVGMKPVNASISRKSLLRDVPEEKLEDLVEYAKKSNVNLACDEKLVEIVEDEVVFEKPEPSRAIDIPGSAESKEHRCLPVIVKGPQDVTLPDEESPPKLEEILLSRDPLAQPQPDLGSSYQRHDSSTETTLHRQESASIPIPRQESIISAGTQAVLVDVSTSKIYVGIFYNAINTCTFHIAFRTQLLHAEATA
ncbi:hypothetical protein GE061_004840 [Apolygus lucorum]|uniref:Bestrophin homolog n=1 Tax=Apolygus lucorum TaxID=248454 RepID=A0A8S9X283_APOLU|nr:hypothetical protein GE061_004840 [Apolygus lucorum]